MKILFVSFDEIPHIGGKSTHICDLMDGLRTFGIESHVVSLRSIPKAVRTMIKVALIPVRILSHGYFDYYYRRISGYIISRIADYVCIKRGINFVAAQDTFSAAVLRKTLKKHNLPSSLTMHTYFGLELSLDDVPLGRVKRLYEKMLDIEISSLEVVDGIISVDNRIHEHVKEVLEVERAKGREVNIKLNDIIFNFTNINNFAKVSREDKLSLRKRYGLTEDQFVITCVRRLVEKNGVSFAVRAMAEVNRDSKAVLLIFGDGNMLEDIKGIIEKYNLQGRVISMGSLPNERIKEAYGIADISVVPSITVNGLQEATSISAIEAMAFNLPTIASRIGGLKDMITHGENGILVEEGDIDSIARAIEFLEQNVSERDRLGEAARGYVKDKHSHIAGARRYLDLFEAICNKES